MRVPLDPTRPGALIVSMFVYDPVGEKPLELRAAVDTGASVTIIPWDIARSLGYPTGTAPSRRIVAGDGVYYAPTVLLSRVDVGPASARDVEAICHDLPQEALVDALVGLSFLTRFDVHLDFAAWEMELAARGGSPPRAGTGPGDTTCAG
jgi:clan AA aspartic protease (TIGR02281 family)